MADGKDLLAAVILGAIFAGDRKKMDLMDDPIARKRKRSTIIGVVVLVGFVIAVICGVTYQKVKDAAMAEETKATVDNLAYDFAQGNSDMVMNWARGECVDSWGNQVILSESSSEGVQFVSKGLDGELGTEDDVIGEVHHPPKKVIPTPPKEKKGVVSKIKSFFSRD